MEIIVFLFLLAAALALPIFFFLKFTKRCKGGEMYENMWEVFPIFYKSCDKCKVLFKLVKGWKTTVSSPTSGREVYLCSRCAKTFREASGYFSKIDSKPIQ